MTFRVGSNDLAFELVPNWEELPEDWTHPDVAAVCTDSADNVYIFCRAEHPVMVYDKGGAFLGAWGEDRFTRRAHGMFMTPDDQLFLVDEGASSVGRYTVDGALAQQFGPVGSSSDSGYVVGVPDSVVRGAPPYNRPTNAAVGSGGSVYVSDGYGNARVHRFSSDGVLLGSWGEPGSQAGEFQLPHGVWVHGDGRVFVADRKNDRIQIFSPTGEFLAEWLDVQRPQNLAIDGNGLVYVAELGWQEGGVSARRGTLTAQEPSRLSILDLDGNVLLRWCDPDPERPGYFFAAHDVWVDSEGSIYFAEVVDTIARGLGIPSPNRPRIQKFVRL